MNSLWMGSEKSSRRRVCFERQGVGGVRFCDWADGLGRGRFDAAWCKCSQMGW
jgi:hypothetical protein